MTATTTVPAAMTAKEWLTATKRQESGFYKEFREAGADGAGILAVPGPASLTQHHLTEADVSPYRIPDTHEVVFVDGHHAVSLDRRTDLPGVSTFAMQAKNPSELLEMHLGRHAGEDGMVGVNAALATDGLVIDAEPGAEMEPTIHLLHIATGTAPVSHHLRNVIVAGSRASVSLVESYVGLAGPHATTTTAVTEIAAGAGAHVGHVRLEREGLHTAHHAHTAARLDRDAVLRHLTVALGAKTADVSFTGVLGGEGSEIQADGLLLATGSQSTSMTTLMEHDAPHTTSRELVKAVLDGNAHGTFLGNVKVRPDAQKTNAEQTNRNLLLSTGARMDSTPQLEIEADDVKCSHGSTIGQLREDALFFLRSRGLGPEQARLLLTQAFAEEVLARGPPSLRGQLDQLLTQWFACRSAGVRP